MTNLFKAPVNADLKVSGAKRPNFAVKKVLFLVTVLLASCSQSQTQTQSQAAQPKAAPPSRQQQAEVLVKGYLDSRAKHSQAYQPVSFSKLDTVFFPYTYSEEGSRLLKEEMQLAKVAIKTNSWNSPRLKKVTDSMDYGRQHYHPTHILRYKIAHTYKLKNASGMFVAATDTFFVDTTFKLVKKQQVHPLASKVALKRLLSAL